MCIEKSYLISKFFHGILDAHDYAYYPLQSAMERYHGARLVRAEQTIRAILTNHRLAKYLYTLGKSAGLFFERTFFSQYNVPLEFLRIYYRSDRTVLYNELQGLEYP